MGGGIKRASRSDITDGRSPIRLVPSTRNTALPNGGNNNCGSDNNRGGRQTDLFHWEMGDGSTEKLCHYRP